MRAPRCAHASSPRGFSCGLDAAGRRARTRTRQGLVSGSGRAERWRGRAANVARPAGARRLRGAHWRGVGLAEARRTACRPWLRLGRAARAPVGVGLGVRHEHGSRWSRLRTRDTTLGPPHGCENRVIGSRGSPRPSTGARRSVCRAAIAFVGTPRERSASRTSRSSRVRLNRHIAARCDGLYPQPAAPESTATVCELVHAVHGFVNGWRVRSGSDHGRRGSAALVGPISNRRQTTPLRHKTRGCRRGATWSRSCSLCR